MNVLGYIRVSTDEQADSGAGLAAQEHAIRQECQHRGWTLQDLIVDAGYGAKDLKRPGVQQALDELQHGHADALVVAKLDRLSRSMLDFATVMATAQKQGWALVTLDCQVDTTTPAGEMIANVMATFAQFERRLIGQRTKDALAARKAAGVRLGRPTSLPTPIREHIRQLRHHHKLTYQAIADQLNTEHIPTAHAGRCWHPSTVRKAILVTP